MKIPATIEKLQLDLVNLDKVFWPKEKFTKGDLIEYYVGVGKYILPYLKDRPQNLNRHPDGIEGESFYQKNIDFEIPKGSKTAPIYSKAEDKNINYFVCKSITDLIFMVNLGCIEINPWLSRVQSLGNPDFCVIDLDPPDNKSFDKVIETAQVLHELLYNAKIPSFPKTSGAEGLHILIPLGAKYTYKYSRKFAHVIADIAHTKLPEITTLERSPQKRKNKIYVDYLQNSRGQTIAAPYSIRPREGIPVSAPLEWSEVKKGLDPLDFNVFNIFNRLKIKGDLMKGIFGKKIDMESALPILSDYPK